MVDDAAGGADRIARKRAAPATDAGEGKRRRSLGGQVSSPVEHPVVRLQKSSGAQSVIADLVFQFQHTPVTEARTVSNRDDFRDLLVKETKRAVNTSQTWLRSPRVDWILGMAKELTDAARAKLVKRCDALRGLRIPEDDVGERWGEVSDLASQVIFSWFEGQSLEDVLRRAEELGHLQPDLFPGCLLQGDFAEELATAADIDMPQLISMIRPMCAKDKGIASVYKVSPADCFQVKECSMPVDDIQAEDGQGSLNTIWNYDEERPCKVDLLDEFHDAVDKAAQHASEAVVLNQRIYLIWKLPHYVTSYHQDTHVPPHFTLYNQVSGPSFFHFLPLLVGLFVTYVGRRSVTELKDVLTRLDQKRVGSILHLRPGQVALICPFGSHGVWVPSTGHNPTLADFRVSLIRAAELFVRPLLESVQGQLRGERWKASLDHCINSTGLPAGAPR